MNKGTLLAFVFCLLLFGSGWAAAQSLGTGYQLKKIVIDPGHGGKDPGATAGNVREKDIVLDIALQVGRLIEQHLPEVQVIYTRKTDVFVELMERSNIANRNQADLFISIHADAARNLNAGGSSSWVMGLSKEGDNLELAMRENSVITYEEDYQTKYEGFDPNDPASYIMFALMQSAHFDRSIELGTLFQKHYGQNTSIPITRGVRQNAFLVLHRTTMPAVLTEIGFVTHADDRAFMTSKAGKEKIARAIFNTISEYKGVVEGNARLISIAPVPAPEATAAQPAAPLDDTSAPVFRIQVSASRNRMAPGRFGPYDKQVVERSIDGLYKYFVGETRSYTEAVQLQNRLRASFKDAFIVPFRNDKPVPLTEDMRRR